MRDHDPAPSVPSVPPVPSGIRPGAPPPPPGPAGADQRALWAMLAHTGHPWRAVTHPPVATVAESASIHAAVPALHTKNLFLTARAAGGGAPPLWLVTVPDTARVDLATLARRLGSGRLSFASAEAMGTALRLTPGSVTPLGIIADPAGRVRVVLDSAIAIAPLVGVHPLRNDATLLLSGPHLIDIIERFAHIPFIAAIPRRSDPAASDAKD